MPPIVSAGRVTNALRNSVCRLVLASVATCVCVACLDNSCEQISERPVPYTDGYTNAQKTFYESSKSGEPFLRFPAWRVFRMRHGLTRAPATYVVYVSLRADGVDHTEASGNLALMNVTDTYVEVKNDTCTDLFVRVVASTASQSPTLSEETDAPDANGSSFQDAQAIEVSTTGDAS
jgi:hypothetical protein